MKGANFVGQMVADPGAITARNGANRALGDPLDPVFRYQLIKAIAIGAKRLELRVFAADGLDGHLQQADFCDKRLVKSCVDSSRCAALSR